MLEHPVFLASLNIESQPTPEVLVTITNDILLCNRISISIGLHLSQLISGLFTCCNSFLVIAININTVYRVNLINGQHFLFTVSTIHAVDKTRSQQTLSLHSLCVYHERLTVTLVGPYLHLESTCSRGSKLVVQTSDRQTNRTIRLIVHVVSFVITLPFVIFGVLNGIHFHVGITRTCNIPEIDITLILSIPFDIIPSFNRCYLIDMFLSIKNGTWRNLLTASISIGRCCTTYSSHSCLTCSDSNNRLTICRIISRTTIFTCYSSKLRGQFTVDNSIVDVLCICTHGQESHTN